MAKKRVVKVLAIRRVAAGVSADELVGLKRAFVDAEFEFLYTNPVDHVEHARDCRELQPEAVLLPRERPIPATAMEEGYPHLTLDPTGSGKMVKLKPLKPEFEPFKP